MLFIITTFCIMIISSFGFMFYNMGSKNALINKYIKIKGRAHTTYTTNLTTYISHSVNGVTILPASSKIITTKYKYSDPAKQCKEKYISGEIVYDCK